MNPSPSTMNDGMKKSVVETGGESDPDVWPLTAGKPYFYVVLKTTHLAKTYRMTIPNNVAEKLPIGRIPAKIVYRGKEWDLLYIGNQGISNCRLENKTWAKFVIENNLVAEDTCVFELMEGDSNCKSVKFRLQVLKDEFPAELIKKVEGGNANTPISID